LTIIVVLVNNITQDAAHSQVYRADFQTCERRALSGIIHTMAADKAWEEIT
jgi:hypothetical protein